MCRGVVACAVLAAAVGRAAALLPSGLLKEVHPGASSYPWQERWFAQELDHFGYAVANSTWQQRYLVNDQYWRRPTPTTPAGPVFFYTGNEGTGPAAATSTRAPRPVTSVGACLAFQAPSRCSRRTRGSCGRWLRTTAPC